MEAEAVVLATGNSLNVTTKDVIQNYNRLYQDIQSPEIIEDIRRVEEAQERLQNQLLTSTIVCPVPTLEGIRERLPGLKAQDLQSLLQEQLYNPEVQQAATCLTNSILYASPFDRGSLTQNQRIRSFFQGLRRIGPESVEGYALVSSLGDTPNFFIIKTARDPSNDSLAHELLVGLFGTNRLRAYVPNFAYVYGGFKCSPPTLDENGKVVSWCLNNDRAVNYVLYENVAPSISLDEFCKKGAGKDWLSLYLQLLFALRKANQVCQYTHYDLHTNNVLVREPPDGPGTLVAIPYETEVGKIEYLLTPGIATVIDYGFSHIMTSVQGRQEHFGRSNLLPYSIFPDRPWPLHDAYKVLLFSLAQARYSGNTSLLIEGEKIFRFFNKSDPLDYSLKEQRKVVYSFPLDQKTQGLTLEMLIQYIRTVCDTSFLLADPGEWPLLACANNCVLAREAYAIGGLNSEGPVSDLLEFYDTYSHLIRERKPAEAQALTRRFNYSAGMTRHRTEYLKILGELRILRSRIRVLDLSSLTISQLMDPTTVQEVRRLQLTMAEVLDLLNTAQLYRDIGWKTALLFRRPKDAGFFRDTRPNSLDPSFSRGIREGLQRVITNNKFLDNLLSSRPELFQVYGKGPASWYWEGRILMNQSFPIKL